MARCTKLNVQLIAMVQTFPVLYIESSSATRQQKNKAWLQIAALMKLDVSFLQKRWQSLCITLKKVSETKDTNWIYLRHMKFLQHTQKRVRSETKSCGALEQFLDSFLSTSLPIKCKTDRTVAIKTAPEESPENILLMVDSTESSFDAKHGDPVLILNPITCSSESKLHSRLIELVKEFPKLYQNSQRMKDPQNNHIFKLIAKRLYILCTCPVNHTSPEFVQMRWYSLFEKFRREYSRNRFAATNIQWEHYEELLFLVPFCHVPNAVAVAPDSDDVVLSKRQKRNGWEQVESPSFCGRIALDAEVTTIHTKY